VGASTAIVAVGLAATYWIASLGPAPLGQGLAFSAAVVDREGKLLRPYTTPEGRWRLPATRADVDPRFVSLLLAYEDKRFSAHHGIDLLALGRALAQLVTHGHIVTGASTITMQIARLLEPRADLDISVAMLAVDHASGAVLARVASADYFDARRAGQVDMTAAVRSPGSTLKPFIYGLGFEDGLIHPETLIEDRPV